MAREFAKQFYKSRKWMDLQRAYAESKHYICERCGKAGRIVHHKEHLNPDNITDPHISMGWDNLELLCIDCHNAEHLSHGICRKNLFFDENGDICERKQSPRS